MPTPVKYAHSEMRGAVDIKSNTAGTLISALDAFFVTGFGSMGATGVVVSGGIATASFSSGSFEPGSVVLVSGATPAALNGEQRVISAASNSIDWATSAPDGPATGTITIKSAPLGWEKVYSATNVAVYRSTDVAGLRNCVRVDETVSPLYARVLAYEEMTDVSSGTGPYPTAAQESGGGYWWKNNVSSGTPLKWTMVGDSRFFFVCLTQSVNNASYLSSFARGFGDLVPLSGVDSFYSAISVGKGTVSSTQSSDSSGTFAPSTSSYGGVYMPKALSGLGTSVLARTKSYSGAGGGAISGNDATFGALPSRVDGEIKLAACYVTDGVDETPRALVPGMYYIPQSGALSVFVWRDTVSGAGPLAGRKLFFIPTAGNTNSAPQGGYLIDITGPWR